MISWLAAIGIGVVQFVSGLFFVETQSW